MKTSSSLGRASDKNIRNIRSILRYFRGNHGIMTVQLTTLNLEAVKRAPVGSVLTFGDSDRASDADRPSVNGGTRSKHRVENYRHLHSAVAKRRRLLHSLESVKAWVCDHSGIGYDSSEILTMRRLKRHNRSCAVIPLRRLA